MLTLAMDTSTRRGSVALGRVRAGEPPTLVGERTLEVSATHSETVLPAIDDLLTEAGIEPSIVEAVVVGSGPGSFTGVRIAASLARGFCFHTSVHMYNYSSLAVIALGSGATGDVCALVDSRRGQVYAAGYGVTADPAKPLTTGFGPRALALDDLLTELDLDGWRFAGPLPPGIVARVEDAGAAAVEAEVHPTARALLALLARDPEGGRIVHPASWEPEYIRASSAERRVGASS